MRGIEGEQVLLRIILSESRTHDHQPLFRTLVELLRAEGLAGTTVLKGIAGFGHDHQVHTANLEVTAEGLPVIIEAVDTAEQVERVLPKVEALMAGGLIMLERAHVIRYAQSAPPAA
jgi:hypothetical protein